MRFGKHRKKPAPAKTKKKGSRGKWWIGYHAASRENAVKIKKGGFKPSEEGRLGKGVYLCKRYFAAKAIAKKHVRGKAAIVKVKFFVKKNRVKRLGKANPKHSNKERFVHKTVVGTHPPWVGLKKGFTEFVVHNPKRIKVIKVLKA